MMKNLNTIKTKIDDIVDTDNINVKDRLIITKFKVNLLNIISTQKNNLKRIDNSANDNLFYQGILETSNELFDKIKMIEDISIKEALEPLKSILTIRPSEITTENLLFIQAIEDYFYGLQIKMFYKCKKQKYEFRYDVVFHPCFKYIPYKNSFRDLYHSCLELQKYLKAYCSMQEKMNDEVTLIINKELKNNLRTSISTFEKQLEMIDNEMLLKWAALDGLSNSKF